jgi:sulfite reductase (ferredoxin)
MTIAPAPDVTSAPAPAPVPRPRRRATPRHRALRPAIEQYLAGEITEDVFRVMRLNNGIYGQRQGGTNQMVRIKVPAGTITPNSST